MTDPTSPHPGATGPGPVPPVLRAAEGHARDTPDAVAVRSAAGTLGYRELWDRSAAVAGTAARLGAGSGTPVGVHLERSADLVVALVGLLRAGCVVVPLDVAYPLERLRFMCADAGIGLVLGHDTPLARLDDLTRVRTEQGIGFAVPGDGPDRARRPVDGTAYVIYTSGSTGRPKGVQYGHRNLANLIAWQVGDSGCGAGERTLQFSPASFDVIFQEVLTTLSEGGTLVCCTEDERLDPQLLWDLVERERISRLFLPFVMIQSLALFVDDVDPDRHPLREIITTGEQVRCTPAIRALFTRLPDCRLVNQWGTTETHTATAYTLPADVSGWPDLPPIGRPIAGTTMHVRDAAGRAVPDGDVGELWVAGDAVGPGYLGLPERTARSFGPDPADPAVPAYRSGDLGRRGPGGLLEYLGREDTMVKVRGFRIELGEIENVLTGDRTVAQAAAVVVGADAEERAVHAYVVPTAPPSDVPAWVAQRYAGLRSRLPDYLVPSQVHVVESLPRTPSGKIDRRALAPGERT